MGDATWRTDRLTATVGCAPIVEFDGLAQPLSDFPTPSEGEWERSRPHETRSYPGLSFIFSLIVHATALALIVSIGRPTLPKPPEEITVELVPPSAVVGPAKQAVAQPVAPAAAVSHAASPSRSDVPPKVSPPPPSAPTQASEGPPAPPYPDAQKALLVAPKSAVVEAEVPLPKPMPAQIDERKRTALSAHPHSTIAPKAEARAKPMAPSAPAKTQPDEPGSSKGVVQPRVLASNASAAAHEPVSSSSPTVSTAPIDPGAMSMYSAELRNLIETHKAYPMLALRRREEGTVVLRIALERSGRLIEVKAQSEASPHLIAASIEAVKAAAPFPPFPAALVESHAVFELPITYKLQ